MYCPECGCENPDETIFCQNCGNKLVEPLEKSYIKPDFLDMVLKGKNNLWRYILGIIIIFTVFYGYALIIPEEVLTWGPVVNYIIQDSVYIFYILAIVFVIRFLHKRSFISLITSGKSIYWRPILMGFALYFGLMFALSFLPSYLTDPGSISLNHDLGMFLIFIPFLLILVPLQTTSEELFFRGYLLQGTGFLTRNFLILAVLNGILFMIPHLGNPEMATSPLAAVDWLLFGFIMAYITMKSGALELALGGHAANNLFFALMANYENSAQSTPSLFFTADSSATMANEPISIFISLLNIILIPLLYYILLFKVQKIRGYCQIDRG